MRKDLLIALRDALLKVEEEGMPKGLTFDMLDWWREEDCKTRCCAAGLGTTLPEWQEAGLGRKRTCAGYAYLDVFEIRKKLELTPDQFNWIFLGDFSSDKGLGEIKPYEVARAIDQVLEGTAK